MKTKNLKVEFAYDEEASDNIEGVFGHKLEETISPLIEVIGKA